MNLDFFIMAILTIFVAIPARIFLEIGLDPEKISTIFFLLTWVVIFSVIRFITIISSRGFKYIFRNFLKNSRKSAYSGKEVGAAKTAARNHETTPTMQ